MSKTFDPTKPVQTRDGRPARIICTDVAGELPVIALINTGKGEEAAYRYHDTGVRYLSQDEPWDLINIPETHEVVVYFAHTVDGKIISGRSAQPFGWKPFASKLVKVTEGEFAGEDPDN